MAAWVTGPATRAPSGPLLGPANTVCRNLDRQHLESRQRDGARVRVNNLRVERSRPGPLDDRLGFEAECSWEVSGRVGHWGHFHDRTNLYRATFVVEPIEDTWKITGLTLHSRDRDTDSSP